jgi:hypothetical protein
VKKVMSEGGNKKRVNCGEIQIEFVSIGVN